MAYSGGDVQLLREGYLYKSPDSSRYLSILKKWQQKWFRLMENGDLLYFDNDKASKPGGIIHLLNCRRVFDPKIKGLHMNHCLGLEVGETTYYIKADNASGYNAWLDIIAAFAEKTDVRHISPSPSPSSARRSTGLSEVRGHRADSIASRTFSTSAKVRSAEKSGWLYKTGPNNKGWNHRFFILSNAKLSYYKTDKAEKSLGTIDLRESIAVRQSSDKKGFGMTVQVPNRTYHISAETESEREEWIFALTTAMAALDVSKLSVVSEPLVRSGSGSSQSSVTSRELFTSATTSADTTNTHLTGAQAEQGLELSEEDHHTAGEGGKRPERDSVVQLLEAEVDALREQVSGLHAELQSSSAVTTRLQSQLQEAVRQREREVHSITVERDNLHIKLSELESVKQSLESVNDSLRLQLDEARDDGLEAEEMTVRAELEETQVALTAAEEDIKNYQQELSDTQQLLQEIQAVAQGLQSELIRRGDFTPDIFRKNRSLSTTATELLSSIPSSPHLDTHMESEERPATAEGYRGRREEGDGGTTYLHPTPLTRRVAEGGEGRVTDIKEGGGDQLEEERLKWQMEMENLRRECELREEVEHQRCAEEVKGLEERVVVLEERCRVMTEEMEMGRMTMLELDKTKQRMGILESGLKGARERVTQLQVEKEKALADLKNIHKINRTIEKRLSEIGNRNTEGAAGSEARLDEISGQLELVLKERDQLRVQLDELMASRNGLPHTRGDNPIKLSPSVLRRKGRATVAASHHSLAAPAIYAERSGSFSNVASSVANGLIPNEDTPVKPQRPSKALISGKLMVANHEGSNSRPKTWGANMFQNLFRS